MSFTLDRLKKEFPHLAAELENSNVRVSIDSVRSDTSIIERTMPNKNACYNPDVIDFFRRCDTNEQAIGIVDFLEKRNELSQEYAKKLRKQINEKGVRSFGAKKGDDYYFYYFNQKKTEKQKKT